MYSVLSYIVYMKSFSQMSKLQNIDTVTRESIDGRESLFVMGIRLDKPKASVQCNHLSESLLQLLLRCVFLQLEGVDAGVACG